MKCMNACKNYQKMIKDYDEGRLSLKQDIKNCIDSYDFKTLVELKLKKSIEQCKMTRQWNHDMKMMHALINIIMVLMFIVCIIIRFY